MSQRQPKTPIHHKVGRAQENEVTTNAHQQKNPPTVVGR